MRAAVDPTASPGAAGEPFDRRSVRYGNGSDHEAQVLLVHPRGTPVTGDSGAAAFPEREI